MQIKITEDDQLRVELPDGSLIDLMAGPTDEENASRPRQMSLGLSPVDAGEEKIIEEISNYRGYRWFTVVPRNPPSCCRKECCQNAGS